jgi:hypothetical protein
MLKTQSISCLIALSLLAPGGVYAISSKASVYRGGPYSFGAGVPLMGNIPGELRSITNPLSPAIPPEFDLNSAPNPPTDPVSPAVAAPAVEAELPSSLIVQWLLLGVAA